MGSSHLRIPLSINRDIPLYIIIFDAEIPILLGMDVLNIHLLLLNFGSLTDSHHTKHWNLPKHFHQGHIFIAWPPHSICFMHLNPTGYIHIFSPNCRHALPISPTRRPFKGDIIDTQNSSDIPSAHEILKTFSSPSFCYCDSISPEDIVSDHESAIYLL